MPSWRRAARLWHRPCTLAAGDWAPPLDAATSRVHALWFPLTLTRVSCMGQALADALHDGAAPELILLDMRGNPLSEAATAALVRPYPNPASALPCTLLPCPCRLRAGNHCLSTREPRWLHLNIVLTICEARALCSARCMMHGPDAARASARARWGRSASSSRS